MEEKLVGPHGFAIPAVHPDRVHAACQRLLSTDELSTDELSTDEAQRLSELIRLLGDPNRVRILYALLDGELCVCDLGGTVEAPNTSVSHALRLLRTAGTVRNRRDGRMIYYGLDYGHVRLLLDLSAEHLCHAARRAAATTAAPGGAP